MQLSQGRLETTHGKCYTRGVYTTDAQQTSINDTPVYHSRLAARASKAGLNG
jgi:hypothetical protein